MGPLGRVWEMGEERACDGSSKSVESGMILFLFFF